MNMIRRKQTASRGGRAGFTLVEVIVVLVILAILAAIAIPALTGYIDKAKTRKIESEMHTQMMALQTAVSEQYAKDGGIMTTFAAVGAPPDSVFNTVLSHASIPGTYHVMIGGYDSGGNIEAYEDLTGDTGSFWFDNNKYKAWGQALVDASGSMRNYRYCIGGYFGEDGDNWPDVLQVFYIPDINSTDPIDVAFLATIDSNTIINKKPMTNGFNYYRYFIGTNDKKFERLDSL
ncbi:MAG: prepilin-type N-terminal cleavage/methylation domain-containing protein [Clostridiales Family XIII bacterium]|jgi:prepilin-type N-terminal cleavage/methylation domain-containing protein|nr:prepilin-type N-terminal cleavage/methylation domain-containing protein [Clostridiales Family XIII bacterium]